MSWLRDLKFAFHSLTRTPGLAIRGGGRRRRARVFRERAETGIRNTAGPGIAAEASPHRRHPGGWKTAKRPLAVGGRGGIYAPHPARGGGVGRETKSHRTPRPGSKYPNPEGRATLLPREGKPGRATPPAAFPITLKKRKPNRAL